jgi:trimeric autotransporter adhesin
MATTRRKLQVVGSLSVLLLLTMAALSCDGFFVDPVLQTITVTPATPGILVGGTQQMTATGIYDDGSQKNITGDTATSWSSTDLTVATVTPNGGLVTGVSAGTASIQATHGIVSGSTSVTVSLTGVTSITAAPSSQAVTISSGLPFCLTATAQPSGQDISSTATWTFTDPNNQTETGITKTTTTSCTGQAFTIGTLSPTQAPTTLGAIASAPGTGNTTVNSNKVTVNVSP